MTTWLPTPLWGSSVLPLSGSGFTFAAWFRTACGTGAAEFLRVERLARFAGKWPRLAANRRIARRHGQSLQKCDRPPMPGPNP